MKNNLEKCIWKEMADDPKSTTFQDVKEGHKLYPCIECSGAPYRCANYINIKRDKLIDVSNYILL